MLRPRDTIVNMISGNLHPERDSCQFVGRYICNMSGRRTVTVQPRRAKVALAMSTWSVGY